MSEFNPIKKLIGEFKEAEQENEKIANRVEGRKEQYGQPIGTEREVKDWSSNTKRQAEIRQEIAERAEFSRKRQDYNVIDKKQKYQNRYKRV